MNDNRPKICLGKRRNGLVLTYEGYIYQENKVKSNEIYWRCDNNPCGVFLHTDICRLTVGIHPVITKEPTHHNHLPDETSSIQRLLLAQMIDLVAADPCAPVRSAYERVLGSASVPSHYMPTFASVESILLRTRSASFPPIPTAVSQVVIAGEWARTWNDEPFLIHLDNNWGIAMFANKKCLRLLGECDTVFVDGTFKTAPKPYYQLALSAKRCCISSVLLFVNREVSW